MIRLGHVVILTRPNWGEPDARGAVGLATGLMFQI